MEDPNPRILHVTSIHKAKMKEQDNCEKKKTKLRLEDSDITTAWQWWAVYAGITIGAFCTRLYKIEEPSHIW